MRRAVLISVIIIGAAILLQPVHRPAKYETNLTTFFRNGKGLRTGARVRVDGVEMGIVKSVRVRPELGECPVEVQLVVESAYDLPIPDDSPALLATEGLLGPTFVEIDTRRRQGTRVRNHGVLKSSELTNDPASQALNRLTDAVTAADNKLDSKKLSPDTKASPAK